MVEEVRPVDHRETHLRSGVISAIVMMLGSSYFDVLLGVIRGIVVMNLIGPAGRGIMRLVSIAHKYLSNSHLGILHGVSKELPQALGRGDLQAADEIESVGATFVMLAALVSGLGLVVFGLLSHYAPQTRLAFMAGGGILVAQQAYALYRCVLRAWGRFPVLMGGSLTNTLAEFMFIVLGAKLFGVVGAMLGWLFADVISALYFRFRVRFTVPVTLSWRAGTRLALTGLPVALLIFSDTLLRTVDGIVVAAHYNLARLGLYSVAMQVATYLYSIPEAAGFVIMPRILEAYAAKGDTMRVQRQVMVPTIAAACLMPVAAGCAFILLPPAVATIVPKFVGCIFAAQSLALASCLLALPVAANGLLIALNREFVAVANKCLGALVIYLGALWVSRHGGSLSQVAQVAGVGYLVASVLTLGVVYGRYYTSRLELVLQLALCYAPLAWAVGALRLSGLAIRLGIDSFTSQWADAILRLVIFVALMLPVLLYGDARTGLRHELLRVGRKLRSRRAGNSSA